MRSMILICFGLSFRRLTTEPMNPRSHSLNRSVCPLITWSLRCNSCAREHQCVASEFAIGPHSRECNPDERIEPMQHLQQGHQPRDRDVMPADVSKFM